MTAERTDDPAGPPHEVGDVSRRATHEHLSHLLPALWKALTRATRDSERMPALESQVSILRKIVDVGPMPPAQLADELYLARPTISNLLRDLEGDGLVTRQPSDTDRRSVLVVPTDYGRTVLKRFRLGRLEVLEEALAALGEHDRLVMEQSLPTLEHLLERLDAIADSVPPESRRPA
jgi:DNA-binding MarR family transcriptional regulator